MIEGRMNFPDTLEAEAFVHASEAAYDDSVARTARLILETPGLRFVTLAGPTCSGKTTTANRLSSMLAEHRKDLHIISIDDFFFDRDAIIAEAEDGEKPDFDSVKAVDVDLFRKTVHAIRRGGVVSVPVFDFETGKRSKPKTLRADRDDIFLFEGIQALYPEIVSILGHSDCLTIFIEAAESIQIADRLFLPPEIRFMRRLVRDSKYRSSTAETVFAMWEEVRKNELENILPYASTVDVRLDSTMAYGINMLKGELLPLLSSVAQHPLYGREASQLLSELEGIQEISPALLPKGSVYREFVG